jgi:soluble lytic murein transglycosylase-like protein
MAREKGGHLSARRQGSNRINMLWGALCAALLIGGCGYMWFEYAEGQWPQSAPSQLEQTEQKTIALKHITFSPIKMPPEADLVRLQVAYYGQDKAALQALLPLYHQSSVYPYLYIRLISDAHITAGLADAETVKFFEQRHELVVVQKLLARYLASWAVQKNWSQYQHFRPLINEVLLQENSDIQCAQVLDLDRRGQMRLADSHTVLTSIKKTSVVCGHALARLYHAEPQSRQLIAQKLAELMLQGRQADRERIKTHFLAELDAAGRLALQPFIQALMAGQPSLAMPKASSMVTGLNDLLQVAATLRRTQSLDLSDLSGLTEQRLNACAESGFLMDGLGRSAILKQDWQALLKIIAQMPISQQDKNIWLYWKAYAMHHVGRQSEADPLWARLAKESDFYGEMARTQTVSDSLVSLPPTAEFTPTASDSGLRQNPALQVIRMLHAYGFWVEAAQEFNGLLLNATPAQYADAALLAQELGILERQISYAEKGKLQEPTLRYPRPYTLDVKAASQAQRVDASLIYAIMRQESRFERFAYSAVGAVGLMQLMPQTAQMVAPKIHTSLKVDTTTLMIPAFNIRLGTRYLKDLRLMGYTDAEVAAGYNAGPGRVDHWKSLNHGKPLAEWVELIPFDETRQYVKNVYANQHAYERLGAL